MQRFLLGVLCFFIASIQTFAQMPIQEVYLKGSSQEASDNTAQKQQVFNVTGKKSTTFLSRTIEGSREGFTEEFSREEALRVHVYGTSEEDAEVHMNIVSESLPSSMLSTQKEKEVSISARYGSTEVYYGDFISDFDDAEFTRLTKPLSGVKAKSKIGKYSFRGFYSSPQGQPKYYKSYGNNTQGPYYLGDFPVVVGSEKVYLNGAIQVRENDYNIDYETGEITFIKRAIKDDEIIETDYDHFETLYKHSTYGSRLGYIVNEKFKLGISYINDSDSIDNSESSYLISPYSHYLIGIDGMYLDENSRSNFELAYSRRDNDLFRDSSRIDIGKAAKIDYENNGDKMDSYFLFKRVGRGFNYILDTDQKRDVREYLGKVGYKPTEDTDLAVGYHYDKFTINNIDYLNEYKDFSSGYKRNNYGIAYHFSEEKNSHDPIYDIEVERMRTKNGIDLSNRFMFLDAKYSIEFERELNDASTIEEINYQTCNAGFTTFGFDRLQVNSNIRIRNRLQDDNFNQSKTYDLNVSSTPIDGYFISTNLHRVEEKDTRDTISLNYSIYPTDKISSKGRYSISTLNEEVGISKEVISRQSGMFDVDYNVRRNLLLKYSCIPNFTRVLHINRSIYSDFANQYGIEYSPYTWLKGVVTYRERELKEIDETDQKLKRIQHQALSSLFKLDIKIESSDSLSFNLNLLNENILDKELDYTDLSYIKTLDNNKVCELAVNHEISRDFISATRYSNIHRSIISDPPTESITQSIDNSLYWSMNDNWNLSSKIGIVEEIDYIQKSKEYSISPGIGISYMENRMQIDFNADYYKKYVGEFSDKLDLALSVIYDINNEINFVLKAVHEISNNPDYKTTEVMGNVEIVF